MLKYAIVAGLMTLSIATTSQAALIFDNGPADGLKPTWNIDSPTWTAFDDFTLGSNTVVTGFDYNAWEFSDSPYISTIWQITAGSANSGGAVLASGTTVATRTPNGLVTPSNPSNGFLHTIGGLALNLAPGTYTLGISNDSAGTRLAIASGPGTGQTLGSGLYQNSTLRTGDHMSFRIYGNTNTIPEPTSVALMGMGVAGICVMRRRKSC